MNTLKTLGAILLWLFIGATIGNPDVGNAWVPFLPLLLLVVIGDYIRIMINLSNAEREPKIHHFPESPTPTFEFRWPKRKTP